MHKNKMKISLKIYAQKEVKGLQFDTKYVIIERLDMR